MSDDDLPIVAFKGEHSDAVFLVSLLESEGIDVTLKKNFMGVAFAGTWQLPAIRMRPHNKHGIAANANW